MSQPTQVLPSWLTLSTTLVTLPDGSLSTSSDILRLPLTYFGPSVSTSLASCPCCIPSALDHASPGFALVIAVLIAGDMAPPPEQNYSLFNGFMHLACGLSVGLTGLAAGYAIGIVGDSVWLASLYGTRFDTDTCVGRSSIYATITYLCRNGAHFDFWRSTWSLRVSRMRIRCNLWYAHTSQVDCVSNPQHQGIWLSIMHTLYCSLRRRRDLSSMASLLITKISRCSCTERI